MKEIQEILKKLENRPNELSKEIIGNLQGSIKIQIIIANVLLGYLCLLSTIRWIAIGN